MYACIYKHTYAEINKIHECITFEKSAGETRNFLILKRMRLNLIFCEVVNYKTQNLTVGEVHLLTSVPLRSVTDNT